MPLNILQVTPSTSLEFQPCHDTYQCTKLSVPLDWTASETKAKGKRVSLAIIRLPAKVPVTDPRYGGSIFVNPGGPGGSGIGMILAAGELLRTIVDVPTSVEGSQSSVTNTTSNATNGKFFDLIGWDPRGIGQTRPMANCFPDDVALMAWMQRSIAYDIPVSNESFVDVWTHEMSLARSCTWRLGDGDDAFNEGIGKFVSTPSVVEDLLAMTEALGEWREKEAKAELHGSRVSTELRRDVEKRMRWLKGEEKVQFWGFSYGTVIGTTFATLHPNRMERMVLDGVVDSNRWYSGMDKFHYLGS
jgi:pimeloyl-ACP methyl ester carboxylesterase